MENKAERTISIIAVIFLVAGIVFAGAGLITVSKGGDILSMWGCASSYPDIYTTGLMEYEPLSCTGIRDDVYLSNGDRYVSDAKAYLIDAEFFTIYPVDNLRGHLPEEYPAMPQVMVSESLAFDLFAHTRCIGDTLTYDGADYAITAVCADTEGQRALYLWGSSMVNTPINLLGLSKEVDEGTRWIVKDRLATGMDAYALAYTVYDATASRHRVYFLFFLFVFGLAALFLLLVLPRIWRFAVGKYRMLKEKSRDTYIRDMLPQIILWSVAGAVFVVLVLVLCKKALDVLAVHLGYLDTPDNFFELSGLRGLFRSIFDPAEKHGVFAPGYMAVIWRGEKLLKIAYHLIGAGVLLEIPILLTLDWKPQWIKKRDK